MKREKRLFEGVSFKAVHIGWCLAIKGRTTIIERTFVIGLPTPATFMETLISASAATCLTMMSLHLLKMFAVGHLDLRHKHKASTSNLLSHQELTYKADNNEIKA